MKTNTDKTKAIAPETRTLTHVNTGKPWKASEHASMALLNIGDQTLWFDGDDAHKIKEIAKRYNASVNHAQALADALRECALYGARFAKAKHVNFSLALDKARAALAAWEGAQ